MRPGLLLVGLSAAITLGLMAVPSIAQNLDELEVRNDDLGRQLRHPNAYRDELNGRRSFRAQSEGPRYNYRYFDHPRPSFQYFQEGQTLKWSWDLFPGGEARIYSNRRPGGYWGPTFNTYNYYPDYFYYPPTVYRGWGW